MTKIKICGIKSFKDIEYVNQAMPDYIGFVFAKSKRHVDFNKAYLLKSELNKQIQTVGVFVNEDVDFIAKCCNRGVIDIVQLHGDEDEKYIRALKKIVYKPIVKAIRIPNPIENAKSIETAKFMENANPKENAKSINNINSMRDLNSVDQANFGSDNICKNELNIGDKTASIRNINTNNDSEFEKSSINQIIDTNKKILKLISYPLFDTYQKNDYGGTGLTFPWESIMDYNKPFFLAGGLNSSNIADAIKMTNPYCVDVSSGVETNGIKDKNKIIEIVDIIRSLKISKGETNE